MLKIKNKYIINLKRIMKLHLKRNKKKRLIINFNKQEEKHLQRNLN